MFVKKKSCLFFLSSGDERPSLRVHSSCDTSAAGTKGFRSVDLIFPKEITGIMNKRIRCCVCGSVESRSRILLPVYVGNSWSHSGRLGSNHAPHYRRVSERFGRRLCLVLDVLGLQREKDSASSGGLPGPRVNTKFPGKDPIRKL